MLAPGTADARDLPQAGFAVLGEVLPGIKEGYIIPIYVHVEMGGDQMDWTFLTAIPPNAEDCELRGRCAAQVQSLSHQVAWGADDTVRIVETQLTTDEGLVIDRADLDGPHIFDSIQWLLSGGTLSVTPQGGLLRKTARRSAPRQVALVPASVQDMRDALSLMVQFNQSLVQLDQCGIRQILPMMAAQTPTPRQTQVVAAARLAGEIARIRAEAMYYGTREPPDAERARLEALSLQASAFRYAVVWPQSSLVEAMQAGEDLDDDALVALTREGLAPLMDQLGPDGVAEILETQRARLIALQRLSARFMQGYREGRDPLAMLCSDISLGG
jgi:hypothetical protein